jgi:hypothetical protein
MCNQALCRQLLWADETRRDRHTIVSRADMLAGMHDPLTAFQHTLCSNRMSYGSADDPMRHAHQTAHAIHGTGTLTVFAVGSAGKTLLRGCGAARLAEAVGPASTGASSTAALVFTAGRHGERFGRTIEPEIGECGCHTRAFSSISDAGKMYLNPHVQWGICTPANRSGFGLNPALTSQQRQQPKLA